MGGGRKFTIIKLTDTASGASTVSENLALTSGFSTKIQLIGTATGKATSKGLLSGPQAWPCQ